MDADYKLGKITLDRVARHAKYLARHTFASPGRMPDVVIVGTMKGGTTSLFSYLEQHPGVHGSCRKEVHYFDRHFKRGLSWYRKHFTCRRDGVVLEATPDYMFHRRSLDRLQAMLPQARIIVLLRDPVTRAYSHFHHSRRKGTERRSFEEAAQADLRWYREHGVLGDDTWQSNDHSYVRRGIYEPQLSRLMEAYRNVLVLRSEDLFADPLSITNRALEFMGLATVGHLKDVEPRNTGNYRSAMPMQRELENFFRPHNERLYALLGNAEYWPPVDREAITFQRADAA